MRFKRDELLCLKIPYKPEWAARVLSEMGLNWKTLPDAEIERVLTEHQAKVHAKRKMWARPETLTRVVVDGQTWGVRRWCLAHGVGYDTLRARRRKNGWTWQHTIEDHLRDPAPRTRAGLAHRPHKGRIVIGNERKTLQQWANVIGCARQSIWKAAKRAGVTVQQEVERRLQQKTQVAA